MADEKEPKNAVEDQNNLQVSANYLFTADCPTCKKYFEKDNRHYCGSFHPNAASHKSVRHDFKEFEKCPAYKKTGIANEGKFRNPIILFIMTFGVVIYGFLTNPLEMITRYWFFMLIGLFVTSTFLLRIIITGNSLTENTSKFQKAIEKFFRIVSTIALVVAFFIYRNGLSGFSNSLFLSMCIWGAFAFNMAYTVFQMFFGNNPIKRLLLILFSAVAIGIIFGVFDFILGVLLMTVEPHTGYMQKSNTTGVIPE